MINMRLEDMCMYNQIKNAKDASPMNAVALATLLYPVD